MLAVNYAIRYKPGTLTVTPWAMPRYRQSGGAGSRDPVPCFSATLRPWCHQRFIRGLVVPQQSITVVITVDAMTLDDAVALPWPDAAELAVLIAKRGRG